MGALVAFGWTGCGVPSVQAPLASPCDRPAFQEARAQLIDALGLPSARLPPGAVTVHPRDVVEGLSLGFVSYPHPSVQGEDVHALLLLPEPLPDAPLPLLLNVHGHWGDGVGADEVHRRAQIAARAGWAVLSIANRGAEHGHATPGWRRLHGRQGLYAEQRTRRSGSSALGWDVVATGAGLDVALAGRLPARIDAQRVAVMGFSGGAERAVAFAATDPRVGAAVFGAYEYAFSSGHGAASCACGATRGAGTPVSDFDARGKLGPAASGYPGPVRAWRWLALAACRPGAPATPRPVLAWDDYPDDAMDAELFALPGAVRRPGFGHAVTMEMAGESWAFLERALRGRVVPEAEVTSALARTAQSYAVVHPTYFVPFAADAPAPGQREQGPPPWRVDGVPRPDVALRLLGLVGSDGAPADPGVRLAQGLEPRFALHEAADRVERGDGRLSAGRSRRALLVVLMAQEGALPEDAGPDDLAPGLSPEAQLDALGGLRRLAELAPDAVIGVLVPRLGQDTERDGAMARYGAELGSPALGVAVFDVLEAHRRLREHPEVDPARVVLLGVGPAGVPALHAATLVGEGGPVLLVSAPVTLFYDGPGPDDHPGPFLPWPPALLAPIPAGASLDPWIAARALGDRVRWLHPRDGVNGPFVAHLPLGVTVPDLAALLAEEHRR